MYRVESIHQTGFALVSVCCCDVACVLVNAILQVVSYQPAKDTTEQASIWDIAHEVARRHENFLKRDAPGDAKKPSSWRPRRMFRATSAKVLQMMNNQACSLASL